MRILSIHTHAKVWQGTRLPRFEILLGGLKMMLMNHFMFTSMKAKTEVMDSLRGFLP